MKRWAVYFAAFASLAGCATHRPPTQTASSTAPPVAAAPVAQPPEESDLINVFMYQLIVPYGAVSKNPAFWKMLDEDVLDEGTYDMLFRNGVRIGRAHLDDWPSFRDLLDKQTTTCLTTHFTAMSGIGDVDLNMSRQLDEELLFVFDNHGMMGRSFTNCQNRLSFSFMRAPRRLNTVRINICPLVARLDEPDSDHLYDLHLRLDVGPGEFAVVAPSPESDDPNRVGNRFLTRDGPTQRYEDVLVLVNQQVPLANVRKSKAPPATQPGAISIPTGHPTSIFH